MLKKMISIVIVTALVMTTSLTFAQAATPAPTPKSTLVSDLRQELKDRIELFKNASLEKRTAIKANQQKIEQIKVDIKAAHIALKQKVKDIKTSNDLSTADLLTKINLLKGAFPAIKSDRAALQETVGKIKEQNPVIKEAIAQRDLAKLDAAYQVVIGVQQIRISNLNDILSIYKDLLSKL